MGAQKILENVMSSNRMVSGIGYFVLVLIGCLFIGLLWAGVLIFTKKIVFFPKPLSKVLFVTKSDPFIICSSKKKAYRFVLQGKFFPVSSEGKKYWNKYGGRDAIQQLLYWTLTHAAIRHEILKGKDRLDSPKFWEGENSLFLKEFSFRLKRSVISSSYFLLRSVRELGVKDSLDFCVYPSDRLPKKKKKNVLKGASSGG